MKPAPTPTSIPYVKHVLAVASGKGGVGKSTVAMNLAVALSVAGQKVGLVDADVYGPSQPQMMGLTDPSQKPQSADGERISPALNHGVKVMSMGFMVEDDTPLVWRGPMAGKAMQQMLFNVDWGTAEHPLDVLVVDMPPGTGDIQLSLAQGCHITGAVIVSTPQDIALLDARKGLQAFRKTNTPVWGLIENMSAFCCPHCKKETPIFGDGGVEKAAKELDVDLLAKIPLTLDVRENTDAGKPVVLSLPESAEAEAFRKIAKSMIDKLEQADAPKSVKVQIEDAA